MAVAIEERVAHHLPPLCLCPALEQDVDSRVTLAIERRKQEDKAAQDESAQEEFGIRMLAQTGEHALASRHGAHEVKADKAAEDAQQDTYRRTVEHPGRGEREVEERLRAHQNIGETGGCDTRDEDGQKRSHRQVDHQHLEREDQSGYRCLEDSGNGGTGSAAHQQNHRLLVHAEDLSQIGTDGRTGKHNRRLGSHRTAEANGDARSHHRRPAVVAAQLGVFGRDGVEHAGNTMRDIVAHHILDKERREVNAHDWEEQEEQVVRVLDKSRCEQNLYLVHDSMQEIACHRGEHPDDKGEDECHLAVGNMFLLPGHHLVDPTFPCF